MPIVSQRLSAILAGLSSQNISDVPHAFARAAKRIGLHAAAVSCARSQIVRGGGSQGRFNRAVLIRLTEVRDLQLALAK